MLRPTSEQQIAVEKFRTGRPLKIAAFAGAGKTSTLQFLAESNPSRGIYLAFNKAIAAEARQKFPKRVDCRTIHAIAFRSVMPRYRSIAKMTNALYPKQLAAVMGYKDCVFPGSMRLGPVQQAHLVLGTVKRFAQSADEVIARDHVPRYGRLLGTSEAVVAEIRGWAVDQATALWARMTDRRDDVPLGHDGYLKLWALGKPALAAQYILLDEAQDTNAVVLGVLSHQDAQMVYVGDKHQQIYEWRGAVNAMEKIAGCDEAVLTQSFRFGDTIATAASKVLATLGETQHIRGNPAVASTVDAFGNPVAVLARTNGTVILEILQAITVGKKPCVVGGTKELRRLLSDVYELKAGKPARSPEFFGFNNWSDVVAFSETEEGEDLCTFVQLVEQHGESKLWAAVKSALDEEDGADLILSTAHKAKGREWNAIRLAPDFVSERLGPDTTAASEVRLFYVAMTRAKQRLIVDPEVLATFTTAAWKKRQPKSTPIAARGRAAPDAAVRPQPPPTHRPIHPIVIKEITRHTIHDYPFGETKTTPHVGSVLQESPGRNAWCGDPSQQVPAPLQPDVKEVMSAASPEGHRGAASGVEARGSRGSQTRAVPETSYDHRRPDLPADPKRGTFWSRVTRLLGAS